jgi:hypothetical protein
LVWLTSGAGIVLKSYSFSAKVQYSARLEFAIIVWRSDFGQGVDLSAPGDTDVTGDAKKSCNRPWAATNLNSPNHLYPSEN